MPVILSPETKSTNTKLAAGVHTTSAAADVIATGLRYVEAVVVSLADDPVDDCQVATAVPGTDGTITIKTWKATSDADATLIAATTFGKKVSWVAVGR